MSSRRRYMKNRKIDDAKGCAFCGLDEDNEVLFGKMITTDAISVHANCMFFASGLSQKGDAGPYLGFLLEDIQAELRRGRKLLCAYCRKRGATIGCCVKVCKKSFHLNCGIQNHSLHQFFGTFQSFCKDHKPKQDMLNITDDFFCHICSEIIEPAIIECCLSPSCCKKNLFHKICLQKYALSAGQYCFKCPLCNNSEDFIKEMEFYGINLPEKDASWELEENAYHELLQKPECGAPTCLCLRGRKHDPKKKSGWSLVTCSYCGFHARHRKCGNISRGFNHWLCEECQSTDNEIAKQKASKIVAKQDCEQNETEKILQICNASTSELSLPHEVVQNRLHLEKPSDVKLSNMDSDDILSDVPVNVDFDHLLNGDSHEAKISNGNVSETKSTKNTDVPVDVDYYLISNENSHDVCQSNVADINPAETTDTVENLEIDDLFIGDLLAENDASAIQAYETSELLLNNVSNSNSSQTTFNVAATSSHILGNEGVQVSQLSVLPILPKLGNKVANLKDIKNVAHNPEMMQLKNGCKRKAAKKVLKKEKGDHPCCANPGRACIYSYFGLSCDKRVRL